MRTRFKSIVVTFLLASFAFINAMENPLTEKLGTLKTNLETLKDGLQNLRNKLEDLKEALTEESSGDDGDEEPSLLKEAWEWVAQQRALNPEEQEPPAHLLEQTQPWVPDLTEEQSEEEGQPTKKGILETISDYLAPYISRLPSITTTSSSLLPTSGTSTRSSHSGGTNSAEDTGKPINIYIETKDAEGLIRWEKMQVSPTGPLPQNPNFQIGSRTVVVRDLSNIPESQYSPEMFKKLKNFTEDEWIKAFQPKQGVNIIADESRILNNYENYQFPNFISAARKSIRIYDEYMLALQKKIDSEYAFKWAIAKTAGFKPPSWWSGSEFLDLVKKEADSIIKKRCEKFGCLNVTNKKAIKDLAEDRKQKNRMIPRKDPDKKRLKKRLAALYDVVAKDAHKLIDYSGKTPKHPTFTDPYAEVFDHLCGTVLDQNLHEDLCNTRVLMMYLQDQYGGNALVQSYGPMINRITALAKKEQDVEAAYNLADFSYDLVSIVSCGVGRAVKGMLNPQTYLDAAVGALNLGVFLAQGSPPMDDIDIAIHVSMFPEDADALFNVSNEYKQRCQEDAQAAEIAYQQAKEQLNNMTWQEKGTLITEVVTTVTLPWLLPRALALVRTFSGRKLVSNLATTMKAPEAESYMAAFGAVEKIAAAEGVDVAKNTVNIVKRKPGLLTKNPETTVQNIQRIAGRAAQKHGEEFEEFLVRALDGRGGFKKGPRQFDGAVGNVWYEAKSGKYWDRILSSDEHFNEFTSAMGERLGIARKHGAKFELHSQTPIPPKVKEWLIKKDIPFTEWF